jgi:hypothetical protein
MRVLARPKIVTNNFANRNFMQPMGRLSMHSKNLDGGRIFFHFLFVPNMFPFKFPMGSHQAPNMFPNFSMCFLRVFTIPYVLPKVLPFSPI